MKFSPRMVVLVVVSIIVLYFLLRGLSYYSYYTEQAAVAASTTSATVPMTCMCSQMAAKAEVAKPAALPAPMPDNSMAPSSAQLMSGSILGN